VCVCFVSLSSGHVKSVRLKKKCLSFFFDVTEFNML